MNLTTLQRVCAVTIWAVAAALLLNACGGTAALAPASVAPVDTTHRTLAILAEEGDAALPLVRALAPAVPAVPAAPAAPAAAARSAPVARATTSTTLAAARVVDRGSADRRFVALSFDAGADPGYTTSILDTLRAQGVVASFGITGRWAEQNPALLRRIVAEGHHLINHTYDHGSFTGFSTSSAPLSAEARYVQLDRTAEVVRSIAGVEFGPYFRPPYGDYDASVNADIAARGYTVNVMWTVDSLGWNGLGAAAITDRCLARATPGAIYIFHVGSQSEDALALPAIIEGLHRQGYALGSVAALLEG
jgi:peptidoglycan/xylan/chitin deacetylase (PgdA/CDA1 family)